VYRTPLVPDARRFQAGRRIRLVLTSDDQDPSLPAIMNFRHASVGTSSLNTTTKFVDTGDQRGEDGDNGGRDSQDREVRSIWPPTRSVPAANSP